ncbi:CENP-Q, a CENPA-CAD centromere complex subunit-domain-containing protein [Truncatella angustata]|uniref:CENP-Q, a CENPA-CAD centromere complex subunit-domain-containing protein n=1 Tax=Truncatella angustata TaxID=152316 RepID=A0A9P8RH57_9PEZI|nr:CENP-Q, a CENPA-CAD centromere complex subunit-domain-containing protein [Truncatella angustata]KAH6645939.1 CENP-Q, a CENPA-CAD centromere complex subunit-domain-containing protein [Truncatella angustata]
MAAEAANQKRKRGRPANASRQDESASQSQLTLSSNASIVRPQANAADGDSQEESRPKKRGRPAKASLRPDPEPEPDNVAALPSKKRKRGRPSLSQNPQIPNGPEVEEPPAEKSKPTKRGRPAAPRQEAEQERNEEMSAVARSQPPKKPGRPPINRSQQVAEPEQTQDSPQVRKRGRPPKPVEATEDNPEADDETAVDSSLLRGTRKERRTAVGREKAKPGRSKKQSRAEADPDDEEDAEAEEEPEAVPERARKRGRPSLKNRTATGNDQVGEMSKAKPGKRGRRSGDTDASTAPGILPKKRGRPSLNNGAQPQTKQQPRPEQQVKNTETAEETEEPEQESDSVERRSQAESRRKSAKISSKPKKRQQAPPEEDGSRDRSRSSSPEPASYRHLATKTRRITRQTIQEKWSPLDATSVDTVANLLHSASRPVLLRLNNLTKHSQAASALNAISNRLRAKLSRGLPFPPATTSHKREDELEYERTVDGIQTLEAQLDPLLHSVTLLQREKERAESELEMEYKLLNTISANARSEIRGRRDQLRKVHSLVPDIKHDEDEHDSKRLGWLQAAEKGAGEAFTDLQDDELQGLAAQLGNHMESMRGNLQQIDGVAPAILDCRAALSAALLRHLDQEAYERALLG